MKIKELKDLIKASVKEAIQEELKDILLEAIKGGRAPSKIVNEEKKKSYAQALNETTMNFTSNDVAKIGAMSGGYTPTPGANTTTEGAGLPPGELNLTQISSLMNSKK